jgi:myo-inositol-1(or 4)-monophosphatase
LAHDPIFLATAVEAALAAGLTHRRYFRRDPPIVKKGPIDLVTAADMEAESAFRELVAARFPSHTVLGEEHPADRTRGASDYRWIIDPLDGTTNFAHGLALFSVSIALEIRGTVEVAVVYDPVAQELFTAERGGGARLNGDPIAVSTRGALIDSLLCTGFPYTIQQERRHQVEVFAAFLGATRAVRRLGSAALDLCYVAAGRFDGFWEEQLHPWDIAAGALVVQEAGGRVTRYDDTSLDLFEGQIIASNGLLHDAMRATIRGVDPDSR